jgi:hypothetical protein
VTHLVEALPCIAEGREFYSNIVIGIFYRLKPLGLTVALGSTQPLTEMSTRAMSWG